MEALKFIAIITQFCRLHASGIKFIHKVFNSVIKIGKDLMNHVPDKNIEF